MPLILAVFDVANNRPSQRGQLRKSLPHKLLRHAFSRWVLADRAAKC
jgi:hypothetical protein